MVNASARFRVDLVVHCNGEPGSPRLLGPINASNASSSPGSVCTRRLRPPPGSRTHPGSIAGSSSSVRPRYTVGLDNPDARATTDTPPRPTAATSAATANRCCRSLRCGNNRANFAASTDSTPESDTQTLNHTTTLCKGYFGTRPNPIDPTQDRGSARSASMSSSRHRNEPLVNEADVLVCVQQL